MYIPDLTQYPYEQDSTNDKYLVLSIGWLDEIHQYPRGIVPEKALEYLWLYCTVGARRTMGYHPCPFCHSEPVVVYRDEKLFKLGSGQIRVFGEGNRVYAAPNLIYHYMIEHQYCPPTEFIQSVLSSPLPGSLEYDSRLQQYGWPSIHAQ